MCVQYRYAKSLFEKSATPFVVCFVRLREIDRLLKRPSTTTAITTANTVVVVVVVVEVRARVLVWRGG